MNELKKTNKNILLEVLVYVIFIVVAFLLNINEFVEAQYRDFGENIAMSLEFSYDLIWILPLGTTIIFCVLEKSSKFEYCAFIPAVILSCFCVLGNQFDKYGNWNVVFSNGYIPIIKACVIVVGYSLLFYFIIKSLFLYLDKLILCESAFNIKNTNLDNWYFKQLLLYPGITTFILLFLAYLPVMLISYPGTFMGDTNWQILQFFGNDSLNLNAHHPVVHTLFLDLCISAGHTFFGSYNIGVFLYIVMQELLVLFTLSYLCKFLIEELNVNVFYIIFIQIYYIIHPIIQSYLFLVTKDIIYSVFVMLFLMFLYKILRLSFNNELENLHINTYLICMACLGMISFRNESKYLLIVSFGICCFILNKYRKYFVYLICFVSICSIIIFNMAYPFFGVKNGSVKEMLSVPFQQTARYVKYYDKEITETEKMAIRDVLNYEKLGSIYNPHISDNVKNTYKLDSVKPTVRNLKLKEYFKVWFQMLKKHPNIYVQATFNNYYYYFYPGNKLTNNYDYRWSQNRMEYVNKNLAKRNIEFSYPECLMLKEFRIWLDNFRKCLMDTKVIRILFVPSIYVWSIILMIFYSIRKDNCLAICLLSLPFVIIAINCLGPCNGFYGRYVYSLIFCMPAIFVLFLSLLKTTDFRRNF